MSSLFGACLSQEFMEDLARNHPGRPMTMPEFICFEIVAFCILGGLFYYMIRNRHPNKYKRKR